MPLLNSQKTLYSNCFSKQSNTTFASSAKCSML